MICKGWSTICTNEKQTGKGILMRTLQPLKWLEDSPTQSSHAGRLSNAWFFGDFSVRETEKRLLKEEEEEEKKKKK
jgi:hypothetical protein